MTTTLRSCETRASFASMACRLGPLVAAAAWACAAAAAPVLVPANSASIVWQGRKLPIGESYGIDWTATSLSIAIANASYVGVQIRDSSTGGARFAAFFNNTDQQAVSVGVGGDPNNGGNASPNLRTLTFLTSPLQTAYTIGSGSAIAGATATYTVMLLTEPQVIGDGNLNRTLLVDGFLTDGTVLPPPAPKARRLQFLGDSLTAGYGAGFDQPTIGPGANVTCGASVMINDAANSYGAVLCANFSADCRIEAVSGITLEAAQPNLPEIWNYTLGSMIWWPTAERVPYDFSSWVPDAVIINLGEWEGMRVRAQIARPPPALLTPLPCGATLWFLQARTTGTRASLRGRATRPRS